MARRRHAPVPAEVPAEAPADISADVDEAGEPITGREPLDAARYACLADFLAAASLVACVNARNSKQAKGWRVVEGRGQGAGRAWHGLEGEPVSTLAELVAMVRAGWANGARRINETLGAIAPGIALPIDLRRKPRWQDQGEELDIHQVYAGRLETAWRGVRPGAARSRRTVTLGVDSICEGGLGADVLFWRGAAVARLCDMLSERGFSVCVITGFSGRTANGEKVDCRVVVKDFGQPASLVDIASCTALPAFFRMLGHHWIQTHAMDATLMAGISIRALPADFADYAAGHDVRDLDSAGKWIKATVATINALEQQDDDAEELL